MRGDGGFVVAPPSRHASGRQYQWVPGRRTASAPGWLLTLLASPAPARDPRRLAIDSTGGPSLARLAGLARFVREAQEGRRNQSLHWAACRAGELLARGELNETTAAAELLEAALACGLTTSEAARTIHSGIRRTACPS